MKDHDHLEEKFFGRKERKAAKKIVSKKDRSKFKKTDLAKREKKALPESKKPLAQGRVINIFPEEIIVDCGGKLFSCVLKGKLKKERMRIKNLVVVGDIVSFEKEGGIVSIEKRRSLLSRKGSFEKRKEQIVASNIDLVFVVVSWLSPPLAPLVIDRFVISAQKGGMEPVIVINKIDLLDDKKRFKEIEKTYSELGYKVIATSVETGVGIDKIKKVMMGKASLFAGESGVGKSSLINALTGLDLETREVAKKTQKGVHTTVGARLIPLEFGGWCIDSPGIQSLGIWDLKRGDLQHHYPEIEAASSGCKYPDCTHSHEPLCKVLELVETGELSLMRYQSFRKLWEELEK